MKATAAKAPYEYAVPVNEEQPKEKGKFLGNLRIGRVSYENHEIRASKDGGVSIGAMVDEYIAKVIESGGLVNEVSMHFETIEEQHELATIYGRR